MRNLFFMRIICIILAIITVTSAWTVSAAEDKKEYKLCKVLIEASGGVVISEQNAEEPVPVGTMAKLMTVFLAAEEIEAGRLLLSDKLKTSSYANSMQGAQIWLMPGE